MKAGKRRNMYFHILHYHIDIMSQQSKISTSVHAVQKFNIKELYKCTEVKFIEGLIKKVKKVLGGKELIQFLAAQAILHRDDVKKRMNRLMATWWNGWFTPHQTTTLPNWIFSQKPVFKSTLLQNGQSFIQVHPPTNSDDLCLLFCIYPSSIWQKSCHFLIF